MTDRHTRAASRLSRTQIDRSYWGTEFRSSDGAVPRDGSPRSQSHSFARVLSQCTVLDHLDLSCNGIGDVGKGRLRASWCGPVSDLVLFNYIMTVYNLTTDSDEEEQDDFFGTDQELEDGVPQDSPDKIKKQQEDTD